MERNTLSHYGWIIVMVLTLSVVLAFATPFGKYVGRGVVSMVQAFRNANDANFNEDHIDEMESRWEQKLENPDATPVYDLQQQYHFDYYSSVYLAANDISNNTIGASADVNKQDAAVGIYTDKNGVTNLVILKDVNETQKTTLKNYCVINLNGKTVSYTGNNVAIDIYSGAMIDGRTSKSKITTENSTIAAIIQVRAGTVKIEGGTYESTTTGEGSNNNVLIRSGNGTTFDMKNATVKAYVEKGKMSMMVLYGTSTVDNCTIELNGENGLCVSCENGTLNLLNSKINANYTATELQELSYSAVMIRDVACVANIENCEIKAISNQYLHYCNGISNRGTTTVKNTNVTQKGRFDYIDGEHMCSGGVYNYNTITLTNCNVTGTAFAVTSLKEVNIEGGTYNSFGLSTVLTRNSTTENQTSRIKNATIRTSETPSDYTQNGSCNKIGLLIGISSNGKETVYVDNCNISGHTSVIEVLLGTASSSDFNSLYISNSTINKTENPINIEYAKVYIGTGCNFTKQDVNPVNADATSNFETIVTETNETYGD